MTFLNVARTIVTIVKQLINMAKLTCRTKMVGSQLKQTHNEFLDHHKHKSRLTMKQLINMAKLTCRAKTVGSQLKWTHNELLDYHKHTVKPAFKSHIWGGAKAGHIGVGIRLVTTASSVFSRHWTLGVALWDATTAS